MRASPSAPPRTTTSLSSTGARPAPRAPPHPTPLDPVPALGPPVRLTRRAMIRSFYMAMREKYTKPGEKIHYYLVEWDPASLSWEDFRGKVLGATDPATAADGSLRKAIFTGWKGLGLKSEPNVGDNGAPRPRARVAPQAVLSRPSTPPARITQACTRRRARSRRSPSVSTGWAPSSRTTPSERPCSTRASRRRPSWRGPRTPRHPAPTSPPLLPSASAPGRLVKVAMLLSDPPRSPSRARRRRSSTCSRTSTTTSASPRRSRSPASAASGPAARCRPSSSSSRTRSPTTPRRWSLPSSAR